jgi:hypothetical protein
VLKPTLPPSNPKGIGGESYPQAIVTIGFALFIGGVDFSYWSRRALILIDTDKEIKMARAITVKVATPKVINALETKLAQLESDYTNQETLEEQYQEARKAYFDSLTAYALKHIALATNFRVAERNYGVKCVNIDFDVPQNLEGYPTEPNREFKTMAEYQYENAKSEITNALNILRMTDEETVNASTMKSIAQYL